MTRPLLLRLVPATSASAQPAPEAGRIARVVVDAETGERLPGASVRLSGPPLGTSADPEG